MERLRGAYARLRTWPGVGPVASRAVWAVKGALGRPVVAGPGVSLAPARAPRRAPPPPPADTRLLVAMAAVQGLSERVATLERPAPALERPVAAARPGSASVVVSTLDRAPWLDRALTALAYQRHPDVEVIVVAGPSRDGTDAVLARHAPRIQVVRCPVANLSASRNLGLLAARGEIVAFLDDDAQPEPDWLERLVEPYADGAVGGVGGPIRDASGVRFQCRVMVSDRFGRSRETGTVQRARPDAPGPEAERFLTLTGANSSFRRSALLAVGGFDEAYSYFLDETDACLRLVEAGWRLEVAAEAEVHHAYAPSAQRDAGRAPKSLFAPARSTAYFAFRNGARRLGAAAVADHLQLYADELRRDIGWRQGAGIGDAAGAGRLLAEVDAGLAEGVRLALSGPRRLVASPTTASASAVRPRASVALRSDPDRLKLCLLSHDDPYVEEGSASVPGGIAVWTRALAGALSERGHEVTVIARAPDGSDPSVAFEAEGGAGVWVHRVAPGAPAGRPPFLLAGAPASVAGPAEAAAAEVARVAARRRFDLVMGPLWEVQPAALFGSPWPVAVSLHTACAQMGPFKPEWDEDYRRTHVAGLVAAERRLLAAAPHVLANSRAAAQDIGEALGLPDLPGRAAVIPHGLPDLAHGTAPAPRPTDGVEILFVGRLEPRKGIDVLLAAAAILFGLDPDARLVVVGEEVGDGGVRERFLADGAGAPWLERVRFEGAMPRPELLARYAAADIVVVPSRYESFGLTALEAMVFAKPCVASRAGGLAELVADGTSGRLVPPGDPVALASALLALVRSPALRARMGAAARRLYEARYTADAMVLAYEGWAREIIAPRRLAAE